MRFLKLSLLLFFVAATHPCSGGTIGYSFQGTVSSLMFGGSPYGLSIPTGTSVSGQFVYDTTSAGTFISASATKYLQHQTDGFVVYFGSHEFRASDFLVTVSNDLSGPRDQIDVSFRNDALLIGKSLYVNNSATSPANAQLIVSLRFPSGEWTGTSLPNSLDPLHLTVGGSSVLGAPSPVTVLPKVNFTIQSITQLQLANSVPEPAAGTLAVVALAGSLGWLRMSRRRRKRSSS